MEHPSGHAIWDTNVSVFTVTKKEFFSCIWTKLPESVVQKDKIGKFFHECRRHRAIRGLEQAEKAISTVRGLARTYLAVIKNQRSLVRFDARHTDVALEHPTRCMGSHSIQRAQRHSYDSKQETSWTKVQKGDFAVGWTSSFASTWSQRKPVSSTLSHRFVVRPRHAHR